MPHSRHPVSMPPSLPAVSIIVPVHNGMPWLPRTIDSLRAQTRRDFELIAIDDASTDDSGRYLRALRDPRLTILSNATQRGTSATRNKGLRRARAPYIAYCDQDDLWHRTHLARFLATAHRSAAARLIYARYEVRDEKNRSYGTFPLLPFSKERFEKTNVVGVPLNVMHHRSCLTDAGYFDTSAPMRHHKCEDWEFWLRIADHTTVTGIPEVLGTYRIHGKNQFLGTDWQQTHVYLVHKRLHYHARRKKLSGYPFLTVFDPWLQAEKGSHWKELTHFLLPRVPATQRTALSLFFTAMEHFARGQWQPAAEGFTRLIARHPFLSSLSPTEEGVLFLRRAQCALGIGDLSGAHHFLHKAIARDPFDPDTNAELAKVYLRLNRKASFLQVLRRGHLLPYIVQDLRGLYAFSRGSFAAAAEHFRKSLFLAREHPTAAHNLARAEWLRDASGQGTRRRNKQARTGKHRT